MIDGNGDASGNDGGNGTIRRPPGRLPLFETDPKIRRTVLTKAALGASLADACRAAGIHPQTLRMWRHRSGRAYDAFRAEFDRARARGKDAAVARILRAGKEDWRALAWWLTRCYPEQYSERRMLEITRSSAPRARRKAMRDPELRSALEAAAARLGALREPGGPR